MLEERDAEIAARIIRERVLLAALEPFAKMKLSDKWGGDSILARGDYEALKVKHFRRAAAAYPTHSEGGEALRSQAETNVLAVRSWDSPGFEACVTAEMERMKSARAISPMQVQRANEAWNAQPADASEEDRMKAALETLGASPSNVALWRALVPFARQADFYKPETPAYEQVQVPLEFLRRARAAIPGPLPSVEEIIEDTFASPSPSALTEEGVTEEMVERLRKGLMAASILVQNAEGCILNHFQRDHEEMGMPGWWIDCAADVRSARDALAALASALSPKGGT